MAKLTITVPDNLVDEVVDSLGHNDGYEGTKADFAKEEIINFLKASVSRSRRNTAKNTIDTTDLTLS